MPYPDKPCVVCGVPIGLSGALGMCHKHYEKDRYRRKCLREGLWSLKYASCVVCKRTDYPHQAYGWCRNCYTKKAYNVDNHRLWVYRHTLKKKYGITMEQYNELLEKQGGVCAICRKPDTRLIGHKGKEVLIQRLAVDHNHETKKVRGLLCHKCNQALGFLGENIEVLMQAIVYLREGAETPNQRPILQ